MLLCGDGEGEFCEITDWDGFIGEVIKEDALKLFYQETLMSHHINKAIHQMLDAGIVECVGEMPCSVEDSEASVAKFREEVVNRLGEDVALEIEGIIQKAIDERLAKS